MAQNKRSASSLFSSFLDPSLINDDELLKAKTYVRGASRFEISESDKLNEKEKHLCHDLQAGNYHLEVSSLGTGKFQVIMRISKTEKDVHEMAESTLSGVGKHSKFTKEFTVTKEQEPVMFDLFLKDRSRFYQKASYNFKLTRTSETSISPTNTGVSGEDPRKLSASKLKPGKPLRVKLYIDNEIRYKAIALNARFEELKKELDSEYGERLIKYTDMENDVVTIRSQEDLENFFTTVKQDQTPKLVLESPQSPMSANTMRSRLETPTPLPPSKSLSESLFKQQPEDTRSRSQSLPKSPLNVNTTPTPKPSSQPSTPAKASSSSNTVRNWSIGPFLGAGAFAKVYLGMNLDTGQLMAVKQIDLTGKVDPEEIRNLEREIELMSQLSHDHIVRYHGMEKSKEYLYIFLDYVPGGSLESILHDFALSEAVIRRYTGQILKGLKYLHEEGVIHRDIKAGNILVNETGTVYLADFGCSKKVANALQQNKSITGTPNYLPLEVIQKQQYTKATDIWSLGCTLIEMFTRKPPWHHVLARFDNPYSFFYWLTTTTEELEIPENVSAQAKDFLRKCLKKNPEERASVDELLSHPFVNDEYKEEPSTSPLEDHGDAEDVTTTEALTETETETEPEFDPFADVDEEYHSDEDKKTSSATSSPQVPVVMPQPTSVPVPEPQPQVQPQLPTTGSSLRSHGSMFTTVSSTAFNIAALAKVQTIGKTIDSDDEDDEDDEGTPQSLEDSPHPFELMSLAQEIKAAAEASSPLGRKFKTVSLSTKKSESSLLSSKGSAPLLKQASSNTIKAIKPAKKKVKKSGESEIQSFLKRNAVEQRTMYNLMKVKQVEEDKKKQPQKQQPFF